MDGHRHSPSLALEPCQPADLAAVLSLYDNALGRGYIRPAEVSGDRTGVVFNSLVAWLAGQLVGAASYAVAPLAELISVGVPAAKRRQVRELLAEPDTTPAGLLHALAIEPARQGLGLGTALGLAARERLSSAGAQLILALAWTDAAGCHAAGAFSRAGFERAGRVERVWYEDSLERGLPCPSCGLPCTCAADIYVWRAN
jgi:GNAT superfamily N-acetyltransferase